MKDKILKLRSEGLSYKKIKQELGCSTGTISYYCGEFQKEKTKARKDRFKNGETSPITKKDKFCLYCNERISKPNSLTRYCDNTCHHNDTYRQYILDWKSGSHDGSISGGNAVSRHVRRYLFEKYNSKCSRCSWDTPNPFTGKVILEIEHIDGNSSNNDESNLDLICPNCHSLTSTYKALNSGKGNKKRLKYHKLI